MSDQENPPLEAGDGDDAWPPLLREIRSNLTGAVGDAMAGSRFAAGPGPAPSVDTLKGKFAGLEVLQAAGQGGMGFVYEARQTSPERLVALKLVCRHGAFDPADLHRFQREATILARLDHSAIVPCFYSNRIDDGVFPGGALAFMVMQWVEGRDLQSILAERKSRRLGGLPLEQALEITIQTGCAVMTAHEKGIIHRDLKPANLMLEGARDQGADPLPPPARIRIKVLDFGLGVYCAPDGAPVQQTVVGGTPVYASPEQLDRESGVDGRADIYSLGVIFYQLLTGELPLGSFPNASTIANVDEAVDSLLKRALNPAPERRQKTMAEFVAELERLRDTRQLDHRHVALLCLHGAPGDTVEQCLRQAAEIVNASPGTALVDGRGRGGIWVQARTANAGAALGLRWLYKGVRVGTDGREDRLHRVGMATGDSLPGPGSEPSARPQVNPGADMAARLADLALPGQFLVAGRLFDQVRMDGLRDQVRMEETRGPDPAVARSARFHLHGRFTWLAKAEGASPPAVSELVGQICPADNWGNDPFRPPRNPAGGSTSLDEDDDVFLGEQLAAGEPVPHCPGWTLREKLGQGGYGEVWLAHHPREARLQAFKFCHDALRLDSFRRESRALAALEAELPGDPGFSYLKGQQLERTPFSLRTEYCPLGNLQDWLESVGGAGAVPLARRVDLVSRVAMLVAAAHSLGIIHRDLKPSNILIVAGEKDDPFSVRPRLADFGLSGRDERIVEKKPGAGPFPPTQSNLLSGTRIYRAPEIRTSTQSDVYSLGVILFQLVANRFDTPPAEGWRREVRSPLLRKDIAAAIRIEPGARPSARTLARGLNELPRRRLKRAASLLGAFLAGALLVLLLAGFVVTERRRLDAEKKLADERVIAANEAMEANFDILRAYGISSIGMENYLANFRQLIAAYRINKRLHPELLNTKYLDDKLSSLSLFSNSMLIAGQRDSKGMELVAAQTALDIATYGLEKTNNELVFARAAAANAKRVGDLLGQQETPADPAAVYNYYRRGLVPARRAVKHAVSNFDDFFTLAQLLRTVARLDAKAGRTADAADEWRESLEVVHKSSQFNGDSGQVEILQDIAREARNAVGAPAPTPSTPAEIVTF